MSSVECFCENKSPFFVSLSVKFPETIKWFLSLDFTTQV